MKFDSINEETKRSQQRFD